ncbi:MAG: bifunctional precorrin-2 dehydrogenase/sirohydrochlorin ferrochelatase [Actinomycetota bacterium]|nr:bifunctional precorrin-2 dehydrogenase/sirohydrochlorin ferrochelatase [Actinomycetota bacterium]
MGYYPINIDLEGVNCLVVGGGTVAERKILNLIEAGAKVKVVSPDLTPALSQLKEASKLEHVKRVYRAGDLEGARLVISATRDAAVNGAVSKEAKRSHLLINVVDAPGLCNFIVPSTVRRGDLTVAISTSGTAPALAKKIRRDLEDLFDEAYSDYLAILSEARAAIKERYGAESERAKAWERIVDLDIADLLKKGNLKTIKEMVNGCI